MVLLVFVHGYNLNQRYLQPWTIVDEPLNFNTFTQYFLSNGIFRFRIPMLFAISGYLFALHDDKPHGERIKKRTRTLLVPYFIWSIIGLLVAVLFSQWSMTRNIVYETHLQPTSKLFTDYTFGDWIAAVIWPTSFQLWFLRCLFVYNLIYPWLLEGVLRFPKTIFTVFGILFLATFGIILFEGEGLLFFTLGIWLCKTNKDIERKPDWLNLPLVTVAFIAAAAVKTWLVFNYMSFGGWLFPIVIVLHKFVIVSGLVVVWFGLNAVVQTMMSKKWFIHLTAYSFIIYALHVPILTYLINPTFQLPQAITQDRFLTYILLPLAIILFCIIVGWTLRKTVPKVYAILTGGRGF